MACGADTAANMKTHLKSMLSVRTIILNLEKFHYKL